MKSYNPLKDPNVTQMNYEARWENHLRAFKGLLDGEFPDDSEFDDEVSCSEGDYEHRIRSGYTHSSGRGRMNIWKRGTSGLDMPLFKEDTGLQYVSTLK